MKLTYPQAIARYGPIVNAKWADEAKWMVVYKTPAWFASSVTNSLTNKPCDKIYINKDLMSMLNKALELVKERNLCGEIKTFDGCFNIREVRGMKGVPSCHCYGTAIDFNAADNPLGADVKFSNKLLDCFREAGFTLGAEFTRKDGMHFSVGW